MFDRESDSKALIPYMDNAQAEGVLSPEARKLIERPGVQRQIVVAKGTPTSELPGEDVTIITLLIDDSGSMALNTEAVIKGQNRIIDTLKQKAPHSERVLISTQVLNGGDNGVIDPYHPLAQAVRLDRRNYVPNDDTPLIPRTIDVLGTVILKAQEARDDWKTARTATLIMSDGADTSRRDPREVAVIAKDLRSSRVHLLAAMGFGDERFFIKFFTQFGVDRPWILTGESSDQEILKALGLFAEAAAMATDENKFPLLLKSGTGFEDLKRLPGV